ncbi:FAD-binding protein [Fibrobacterota bacterium]
METKTLQLEPEGISYTLHKTHTLVIGSGAAGLNAGVQLAAVGMKDMIIVSEGLDKGTSINTGSDKQTYYKIGMCSNDNDSPEALSQAYFAGGSMHGDLALVEAGLSGRAFLNLVNLGVQFPRDKYGQFIGYKTDHDPLKRATSFGPYTSKEMCKVLINEVKRRNIPVHENRVVVSLLTVTEEGKLRAAGALAVNRDEKDMTRSLEIYQAENVVFGTGGPGGLYKTSVYPHVHTGGIGLALQAGATAQSLPESQYGLASIKFRWNVSGTYMQVIPRFISRDADEKGEEVEFMRPYFQSAGAMNSAIFLKGYQWPFDPRKVVGGSSLVDILVYLETVIKGRRVYLDFRKNSQEFDFDSLEHEAREYLEKSGALFGTPVERLKKMNRPAIDLYADHNIDITAEPLEIAVCAQHNNGGLAGNLWWESINIPHLFPIGEVNGTHGVYRPGGSALNSGQVAGFRVSEFISNRYKNGTLDEKAFTLKAQQGIKDVLDWTKKAGDAGNSWQAVRDEFQNRMTKAGAHIRSAEVLQSALPEARKQWKQLENKGCSFSTTRGMAEALRNRQLCFAHLVYLEAVNFAIQSGVGSRGSALVLDRNGKKAHQDLGDEWRFMEENPQFRDQVLETRALEDGTVEHEWVPRRSLPHTDPWFETAWAEYRQGEIYK